MKTIIMSSLILAALHSVSCMTTYDAYGRPMQTVDPGAAAVGAVAAGTLGYAIGRNNDNHHHHHGHYYGRPGYYRRGYY